MLASAAAGLLLLGTAHTAQAQTTDGYHTIQVFPLVVDTASFAQRFNFTTPNFYPVTLKTKFFPSRETAQAAAGPLECLDVVVPANDATVVPSLRALCPGLPEGHSAFGFLHVQSAPSSDGMYGDIPVFAAFSRVANPLGNGFTVESFAAHTFTAGTAVVNGLRRLAATSNSPAFQTNCFVGNINVLDPESESGTRRFVYELGQGGQKWNGFIDLAAGEHVRMLDVFKEAGAPDGDFNDAYFIVRPQDLASVDRPGLMSFCTVQDNTSYGADFRVGKTAYGTMGIGSNDGMAAREIMSTADVQGRVFEIGPGNSANTHIVYMKHPDTVQCRLLDPVSGAPLTAAAGLEMRASDSDQEEAEGGNNATGTGVLYTGDKVDSHGGFNNRYLIEVESNETNTAATRKYGMYCSSGSGNTFGYDLIKYKEAVDRF